MRWNRINNSLNLLLKLLVRRRIVIVLFALIPLLFLSVVHMTTSDRPLPFLIASLKNDIFIEISEKEISLVFFAVAVAGFLCSFLALNLFQKHIKTNKRLILCGYSPVELLFSNFIVLILTTLGIAIYVALLTSLLVEIKNIELFCMALFISGFVYGTYGMLVGSFIRGELEGILLIVLLVNIDAGWLQNPLFYAEAQQQVLIRYLPAFYPSQFAIKNAFTNYSVSTSALYGLLYGLFFMVFSLIIYYNKMKLKK